MARTVTCPHCNKTHEVSLSTGPREGTATHAVYEFVRANPAASRTALIEWAMAEGVNPSTALTQYQRARKALGL
jgi:hypothetical protein